MNKTINDYLYEILLTGRKTKTPAVEYNVGITNVAGRNSFDSNGNLFPHNESDALFKEAKELLEQDKALLAEDKYKEAVKVGIETLKREFIGTGIEIRLKPGLGLFDRIAEPSIDMTAIVPEGKEELFHYKLAQIADISFEQKTVMTYRNSDENKLGTQDKERGTSIEPGWRIHLNKRLSLDEVASLYNKMTSYNIYGASVKDNGTVIDIINLSHYNTNYEEFIGNVERFIKDNDIQAISKGITQSVQEVRYYGIDTEQGPTTYQKVRSDYEAENRGLISGIKAFAFNLLETMTPRFNFEFIPIPSTVKVRVRND